MSPAECGISTSKVFENFREGRNSPQNRQLPVFVRYLCGITWPQKYSSDFRGMPDLQKYSSDIRQFLHHQWEGGLSPNPTQRYLNQLKWRSWGDELVSRRRRTSTSPQREPKNVKIAEIAVSAEFLRGWGWRTGPLPPQRQPKFFKISFIFCFIISIQQYSLIFEVLKAATWFSR